MSTEKEAPTVMIFRKFPDTKNRFGDKVTGDVIALMPEHFSDCTNWYSCDSYMHVGQHGGANYQGLISRTKLATPEEYASLKAELESDPYNYNIVVRQRETQAHRDKRQKDWRKFMAL